MKSFLAAAAVIVLALAGAAQDTGRQSPFESTAAPEVKNRIDEIVFAALKKQGIRPARLSSDAVFVRRAYLDVIGTLPTADEARAFIEDRDAGKRAALIDRLLARDEFADYWAMKWCDTLRVKSEFPINLWPNAVQAYHRWIRTAIRDNVPYDRFARELLTASGSNFRDAPVNFYRAVQSREPQAIASTVALTFMGERTDAWPKERLDGMAAFFSQIGYKPTGEWKEEIVYFDPDKAWPAFAPAAAGASARQAGPAGPRQAVFPDGTGVRLDPGRDPREVFASWLTSPSNPYFARAAVNRTWYWLVGRGIVHEPDDIRPDNPPSHPELLALLERELVTSKFDMKQVVRLILNSSTYQLSSIPASTPPAPESRFACAIVRPLDAEVLIDALNQITGMGEQVLERDPGAVHVHPARPAVDRARRRQHQERVPRNVRAAAAGHGPRVGARGAADGGAAPLHAELGGRAAEAAAGPEAAGAAAAADEPTRRGDGAVPHDPVALSDRGRVARGDGLHRGGGREPPRRGAGHRLGARQQRGVWV